MTQESYMIFRVGGRSCAVSVNYVLEVSESDNLSPLPGAPAFVVGIKKFRDEVLPIIDTVKRLSIPKVESEDQPNKYVVIFEIPTDSGTKRFGALVDKVLAVTEFANNNIKVIDEVDNNSKNAPYIKGVVNSDDGFIYVLIPDNFFTQKDFQRLDNVMPEDFWVPPSFD
ncbi:MAG: chemotaxis protein CheW [Bacteroidales bacterium]|nr:chemotaxis protein CheW [Bacteroidales bacterium]